jgi:phosphatidate cytidylyltransferase
MLRQRLQSGVLLGGALVASVFFLPLPWVLPLLLVLAGFALSEFYALLDASRIPHFKVVGLLCGLAMMTGTWFALRSGAAWSQEVEGFVLFAATAVIFLRQIGCRHVDRPWDTMAGTLLGLIYVVFLFNFLLKLLVAWGPGTDGRLVVLYLVLVVKLTDVGAYSIGCAIGRHKLIPRVSPKKTWEGVIGGLLTGLAASLVFVHITHGQVGPFLFHWTDALVLGAVLPIAGVVGDLIESLLKRAAGVKDSGSYIQGMGGLLDVLDSLLFAAPFLYVYIRLFIA